jgi:Radical SAM superfamily
MDVLIDRMRVATRKGLRLVRRTEAAAPPRFQGYIDERSTRHVAGWLRNLADPAERAAYEVVLPGPDGETVLHAGRADQFSQVLVEIGVGDGQHAFRVLFDRPLSEGERDAVIVRPRGEHQPLALAPALRTEPPTGASPEPAQWQGYIDERSTAHIAGWVRDLANPDGRATVEIVLPEAEGERILHRGPAGAFSSVLQQVGVGDGTFSFYVLFDRPLSQEERDRLFVRPAGSTYRLEHAPALKTVFEPISHVAMDIVNNCNLRCPFCVYDYANTKHTYFMSEATFEAALRLVPYVTDGNFWLSCLHEATLHPELIRFIERVPAEYRRKLFYTTNLAKRMPPSYFDFLAGSGMHHLNISVESLAPAIYEKMRKGARHRIFLENWEKLLAACASGSAPPRLRYNLMAYRSNLREIPALVELLRREKRAWQVEIRHTYDEPHIPAAFREEEFLSTEEWVWLGQQLAGYAPDEVLLLSPPGGVGYDRQAEAMPGNVPAQDGPPAQPTAPAGVPSVAGGIPRPLNISMDWDGTMRVYNELQRGPGEPPTHVNYVMTNITYLQDPLRFLLAL